MVPHRLGQFTSAIFDKCVCGSWTEGTLLHIWWECSKIKYFCIGIYQKIHSVIGKCIRKSPKEALLNLKSPNCTSKQFRLLTFLFMAA